ncbi:hypothetical protein [Nocardia farcinica]|uniref:hypothetical protein n=1 Tax=Nocardia farcinica TaxID=37329 RepID=UPI002458B3E2|nr:hypothetical protein [Nocardia farcinica]
MLSTAHKKVATLAAAALIGAFGAATVAAPATAAPVTAPQRAQAPSAGELKAKLQTAINTGAAPSVRAAELEAGEAGLPLMDQVAAAMAATPPSFRWTILGPTSVSGDTLTAQLQTAVDGFDPFYFDLTWVQIDGTWKLTRESQCTVASVAFLPCTV